MSMTLEEAIKHAEYIVNNRKYAISVCWSVKDCEQIAKWLEQLKAVKDLIKQHDEDSMPEDFWYIDEIREAVQE
ncbi:hypothetical protein ACR77U_13355 [Enterococcus faecium]|uniref:hypothetical protein n=1 Tax=Enterococcus faecium TaxID=1352 RepID=UPI003DA4027C